MYKGKSTKLDGKNRRFGGRGAVLIFSFFLFTFYFLLPAAASAQDDLPEIAPPPVKVISKDEMTLLNAKKDIKDRTKLSLELMNVRLLAAEKLTAAEDFDNMFREFGVFLALMDDGVQFLTKNDNGSGKVLDGYKRMEIALRGMAPRIEVIRRELPPRYDDYVRKLSAYLREVRGKVTETLFDDTVVPVKKPG